MCFCDKRLITPTTHSTIFLILLFLPTMTSASATWTPTSLQLRLALSSRVRWKPRSVYLQPTRFASKSGLVIVCVSQRTGSDSSNPPADGLAGWDDSGNDVKSSTAKKKSFIQGICWWDVCSLRKFNTAWWISDYKFRKCLFDEKCIDYANVCTRILCSYALDGEYLITNWKNACLAKCITLIVWLLRVMILYTL